MIITKLEPYEDSGFIKVFADGGYIISIAPETAEKFAVREGMEINEKELLKLSDAVLVRRARERLLYCLDRRLHSEKELRRKLFGKYPQHVIDAAIEEIAALGLIDDAAFAEAFAENRKRVGKKGPFAIKSELYARGVSKDAAELAICRAFPDESEQTASAMAVAEKYAASLDTPEGRRRAFAALCRKGYGITVIKRVLTELCSDMQDDFCE